MSNKYKLPIMLRLERVRWLRTHGFPNNLTGADLLILTENDDGECKAKVVGFGDTNAIALLSLLPRTFTAMVNSGEGL